MKSYDPDEPPKIDGKIVVIGEELGLSPIQVLCDEPGAKVGDAGGVSFIAFVKFVPRIGETIWLDDGTRCTVQRIIHKPVMIAGGKIRTLVPNVIAIRRENPEVSDG